VVWENHKAALVRDLPAMAHDVTGKRLSRFAAASGPVSKQGSNLGTDAGRSFGGDQAVRPNPSPKRPCRAEGERLAP